MTFSVMCVTVPRFPPAGNLGGDIVFGLPILGAVNYRGAFRALGTRMMLFVPCS